MRMQQVAGAIDLAWDEDLSLLVWGLPGIGKTSVYRQFAEKRWGKDYKKHFLIWRLAELESVDLRGTPRERNGRTYWAPPEELPLLGDKNGLADDGIILLDELPQAKMDVKNVATRLLDEKRIGEAVLKPGWRTFGAGNRMGEVLGTSPMPQHLNNRFWHIDAEASLDDWIDNFAGPNNVDDRVVAYLKYQADALLSFDPRSKEAAFCSPRSWTALAKMLKGLGGKVNTMDAVLLGEYCAGHIGRAHGHQFAAFLRTLSTLVTVEQIMLDPENAPLAREPSLCYALATSLALQVTRSTIDAAFKYMNRLGKESTFVFAKKVENKQPNLVKTKAWVTFTALNADYV